MVAVVLVLSAKDAAVPSGDFVIKVNQDGIVNGLVLASCGCAISGQKTKPVASQFRLMKKHIM